MMHRYIPNMKPSEKKTNRLNKLWEWFIPGCRFMCNVRPVEDTQLFLKAKSNKPCRKRKNNKRKLVRLKLHGCAIRCETPLLLYWNIKCPTFPILLRLGALIHDDTSLEKTKNKLNMSRISTKDKSRCESRWVNVSCWLYQIQGKCDLGGNGSIGSPQRPFYPWTFLIQSL